MNRRTFLKVCAVISGTQFVPAGAAASLNSVRWVTSLYDYDRSIGICGAIGSGEETIRAAVMFCYWADLSLDQKNVCLKIATHYIRHLLSRKQHVVYGRQVVEGNEISVDPFKVIECLHIDASTP